MTTRMRPRPTELGSRRPRKARRAFKFGDIGSSTMQMKSDSEDLVGDLLEDKKLLHETEMGCAAQETEYEGRVTTCNEEGIHEDHRRRQ